MSSLMCGFVELKVGMMDENLGILESVVCVENAFCDVDYLQEVGSRARYPIYGLGCSGPELILQVACLLFLTMLRRRTPPLIYLPS